MANVNLTQRDIDYISRVVATEVPASLQRTAPDQYKAMVEAVVDTITNRVASTGFPDSVEAVVNQSRQFSKIAGPSNLNPYGSVKNAPKANEGLQKMVETHLTQRANGKPSTVGNSVNYANPNYSTPNNLGWISDMANAGGVTLGVGDAIHIHGNAPGAKVPDKYTLSVPGAIGNPSQMDSKVMGFSPSRNPGTPRMETGFAQGRTFRNTDGSAFAAPSTRFSGLMTPGRPGVPERSPRANTSAAPTSDFRAPPAPLKITPNKVQTFALPRQAPAVSPATIQRMQDNLTSKMAFAQPNPSNMNISGYGFSTPAKPSEPQATGSATGSINRATAVGNLAVPGRSPGVLGGRGNINPPNVVAPPANVLSNFDQYGNFIGNRQSSAAPTGDFRSTLADRANVPQSLPQAAAPSAPIQTMDNATRAAQAQTARQMAKDQFARDLVRSMPAPTVNVDRGRFGPGPSKAELANQYSQYQRGTVPSAQINPSVYDMVDVPQSSTIASQYASYGAGKIAPQRAATTTQAVPAAPSIPNVPQTVGPRAPSAPAVNAPMTQQQRMDKALADMRVGIPPRDIYKEQLGVPVAPANPVFGNGFRGFGAGGFLGNLLTGNLRNAAGIPGGFQLPGVLGIIQNAVQRLGGPQQAAQAVQTVAPALGQVMGLPAAQQAAKAGANMVIGRDAGGRLGWMADGGLSSGAMGAGWASNNPERNFGGYGGGYDPTPV
jgi:hypothetical protein